MHVFTDDDERMLAAITAESATTGWHGGASTTFREDDTMLDLSGATATNPWTPSLPLRRAPSRALDLEIAFEGQYTHEAVMMESPLEGERVVPHEGASTTYTSATRIDARRESLAQQAPTGGSLLRRRSVEAKQALARTHKGEQLNLSLSAYCKS